MFKADYHVHSSQSFDADPDADIESAVKTAAEKGIDEIALCDHYDVNWVITGENPDVDFFESLNQINAAKKKYADKKTNVLLGIELGQPHQFPEKAAEVTSKNDFDFILCSLHNARGEKDFYYVDYKHTKTAALVCMFEKYTEELLELANWGNFHSLAHITYPLRYFLLNGINIPLRKYTDLYTKLFKILINRGIALEINTSGLRKKINQPSPSFELLKLYKDTGGELVTIGSDAHKVSDIFGGVTQACEKLSALGFKYISTVSDKKLIQKKLER